LSAFSGSTGITWNNNTGSQMSSKAVNGIHYNTTIVSGAPTSIEGESATFTCTYELTGSSS